MRKDFVQSDVSASLCKGLRACGIQKEKAHHILNIVEKWDRSNGSKWTVDRIKSLRHWYLTTLAGKPEPPAWFKHNKEGLPTGIWNYVFKLPVAKALAVLSMSTVYYEKGLADDQREKFLKGINGNGRQNFTYVVEVCDLVASKPLVNLHLPRRMDNQRIPTIFDMNGSVPIHDGQKSMHVSSNASALKALEMSWDSLPQETFDFLDSFRPNGEDLLTMMPYHVLGNDVQLELGRKHSPVVGRIAVLQQAERKARIVANPNRVLQVTLDPLKSLYMKAARDLPTDVTHQQEMGVVWAQEKLRQGIELAGSDLTSASDLLDLQCCLYLVNQVYGFDRILDYKDYQRYFFEVSRGFWFCPALDRNIQWKQGDPLGTGPSFGLLTLSNNACGLIATRMAEARGEIPRLNSETQFDYFRVVGDDIIMDKRIEPYYTHMIEALGGEINFAKTLKSNKVAEFAGRIITPTASYLKRVKYQTPSDITFLQLMSQLGDQAKCLLKPRQRKIYEKFKHVPGIVVNGPWMQDSFGVPLQERYLWYLEEVQPVLHREEPDRPLADYDAELLRARLAAEAEGRTIDVDLTTPTEEGYLPSELLPEFRSGGDPRLANGKTLLVSLEDKDIVEFDDWLSRMRAELEEETGVILTSEDQPKTPQSALEAPSASSREREEDELE